jgi:hypothetical protein
MILENSKPTQRRAEDLVGITSHGMTRRERDAFRVACIHANMTMQDALRELVNRVAAGDIKLSGGEGWL